MVTAWQQRLAQPGLFPVIKPSRMRSGYPCPHSHQCRPILHLLTHAFHTQTSSFLCCHSEETREGRGGGWCLVSPCLIFQMCTDWCHRAAPPLNGSPDTSNFTQERLLSRGDCVTGPFSGSQEIPHSAEVMGGGGTHSCSSLGSQILPPLLLPFGHFPPIVLKNNKKRGRILLIQTKQKEMRRVDPKLSRITDTALTLRIAEDYTCRRTGIGEQR